MKKIKLIVLILFLCYSTYSFAATFGEGVTLDQTTPVSAILDDPDAYLGKQVRIEGMVIDVCAKRGCWMYIAGDRPGEKLQVKVTDGKIVFPMSNMGKTGVVEGVVEELNLSKEDKIRYLKHMAEEKGKPFDPSEIDENKRFIRLRGLGAEITD